MPKNLSHCIVLKYFKYDSRIKYVSTQMVTFYDKSA